MLGAHVSDQLGDGLGPEGERQRPRLRPVHLQRPGRPRRHQPLARARARWTRSSSWTRPGTSGASTCGPQQRSHYVIVNGGEQPNVVPSEATVWYYFRELDYDHIRENSRDRATSIADAAARMTGTTVTRRIVGSAWPHALQPADRGGAGSEHRARRHAAVERGRPDAGAGPAEGDRRRRCEGLEDQGRGAQAAQGREARRRLRRHRRHRLERAHGLPLVSRPTSRSCPGTAGRTRWPWPRRSRTRARRREPRCRWPPPSTCCSRRSCATRPGPISTTSRPRTRSTCPSSRPSDMPAVEMNKEKMARFLPELRKLYYDPARYRTYLEQLGITLPDRALMARGGVCAGRAGPAGGGGECLPHRDAGAPPAQPGGRRPRSSRESGERTYRTSKGRLLARGPHPLPVSRGRPRARVRSDLSRALVHDGRRLRGAAGAFPRRFGRHRVRGSRRSGPSVPRSLAVVPAVPRRAARGRSRWGRWPRASRRAGFATCDRASARTPPVEDTSGWFVVPIFRSYRALRDAAAAALGVFASSAGSRSWTTTGGRARKAPPPRLALLAWLALLARLAWAVAKRTWVSRRLDDARLAIRPRYPVAGDTLHVRFDQAARTDVCVRAVDLTLVAERLTVRPREPQGAAQEGRDRARAAARARSTRASWPAAPLQAEGAIAGAGGCDRERRLPLLADRGAHAHGRARLRHALSHRAPDDEDDGSDDETDA